MFRVGATLAVVPVRTTKKDRVKFPCHCEERSDVVTEGNACGAIPEIKRNLPLAVPAKSRGLPRRFAPRNDVFFFRRLLGAVLAHRTRRNAGDGVPYGDLCRDTPPGVSGPMRPRVGTPGDGVPYGVIPQNA